MKRFADKVVVVTGAGAGLGRAVALRLAAEGAALSLADVNELGLKETARLIDQAQPDSRLLMELVDVTDEQAVEQCLVNTQRQFGHFDGLYNNAGIEGRHAPIDEFSSEVFDQVIDVNLRGAFFFLKHSLRQMKAQGRGAIVNAASVAGFLAVPNLVAYAASKHGVVGMTRSAAIEYARYGIWVNAIAPGAIMTDMVKGSLVQIGGEDGWEEAGVSFVERNPKRRFGQPEEVAALVAFLLSDEASFINGALVPIDGGQSQLY